MSTAALPTLTANRLSLDLSETAFGWLRSSEDVVDDPAALRSRLQADGYLYLRGFFDPALVRAARLSMLRRLDAAGLLDPSAPLEDGIIHPDKEIPFMPSLANPNPDVARMVYGPELLGFYERLLGGAVRHFDYTWVRSVARAVGTNPHCDLVYMGRGTHRLLTCWVPYGEVTVEQSPLMLLEGSHRQSTRIQNYLAVDVDAYCENRPEEVKKVRDEGGWAHNGVLSTNCVSLREKFGGRWLTAHYQPGDFLTFPMHMVHAALDHTCNRVRLSTDTRYQLASEPADERWIGPNPAAHGHAAKRGRIC